MQNLFYTSSIQGAVLQLTDQEAAHCALVLRKKQGDIIHVIDGKGNRYKAGIDSINKRGVECTILDTLYQEKTEACTIAIAPTKNRDRLEWMVEKLVEIGVASIVLLNTRNTIRSRTNLERLEKKAISAVKQSLRFYVPQILEMEFQEVLEIDAKHKYIAHCIPEIPKDKVPIQKEKSVVLIGPEGDFTIDEVECAVQRGFVGLDLGTFRLRTETAAIVAATLAQ